MNQWSKNIFLAITAFVFIAAFVSGCEEENKQNGSFENKKSRVIANENMQLKKQIEEKNRKIEKLKEQLVNCQNEIKNLKEQTKKGTQGLMDNAIEDFEKIINLQQENKELKDKIKILEAQAGPKPLQES